MHCNGDRHATPPAPHELLQLGPCASRCCGVSPGGDHDGDDDGGDDGDGRDDGGDGAAVSHHTLLAWELPSARAALVAEARTWVDKELVHL